MQRPQGHGGFAAAGVPVENRIGSPEGQLVPNLLLVLVKFLLIKQDRRVPEIPTKAIPLGLIKSLLLLG